jgi:hypothetical protein
MSRVLHVILLAALLTAAGCVGGATTERTIGPDGKPINLSRLSTGYTPRETVDRSVGVMKRLQLHPAGGGGLFGGSRDWVVRSDYYSASTRANTAAGEAIELVATWVADGKTELTARTTLNEAQHRNLIDQIVAAMK